MRACILFNPASGKGLGLTLAEDLAREGQRRGVRVDLLRVGDDAAFAQALAQTQACIIVGGDGTVHHALPLLRRSGVPLFHAPLGTENLLARELGMTREPSAVVAAVLRQRVRMLDLGCIEILDSRGATSSEQLFMLMLSLGPDAGVVHRLAATRRGPITHASYVRPALREAIEPALPRLRLVCDGKTVAQGRGMVIVANSRHYGGRLNPCHDAAIDDGLLDAAFLPADNAAELARWLVAARLGVHHHSDHLLQARGTCFEIHCSEEAPAQVDGEAWPHAADALRLRVLPGALRVMAPITQA